MYQFVFLGYQWIMRRVASTAAVPISASDNNEQQQQQQQDTQQSEHPDSSLPKQDASADTITNTFDLEVISRNQFETSPNYDIVRSTVTSATWQMRLRHLHAFLTNHLPAYASSCSAIYPPKTLVLPCPREEVTDCPLVAKQYPANMITAQDASENEGVISSYSHYSSYMIHLNDLSVNFICFLQYHHIRSQIIRVSSSVMVLQCRTRSTYAADL